MAVTVRINEDNYVSLKQLAEKERRSVVAQLDVILDEYFKRDTVGIFVASESDLDGTPAQNTPLPKNTEPITFTSDFKLPGVVPKPEKKSAEASPVVAQVPSVFAKTKSSGFCKHGMHPEFCKHAKPGKPCK